MFKLPRALAARPTGIRAKAITAIVAPSNKICFLPICFSIGRANLTTNSAPASGIIAVVAITKDRA